MDGEGMRCNKLSKQSTDTLNHLTSSLNLWYIWLISNKNTVQLDCLQSALIVKHLGVKKKKEKQDFIGIDN